MKIAVLMGGPSREREISLRSGKAVSRALQAKGYDVAEITEMDHLEDVLEAKGIQAVFIALHGKFGEDGSVQKILENSHIPYTGSNPRASFLALHKELAKEEFLKAGLSTPAWIYGAFKDVRDLRKVLGPLSFPFVLKPSTEGSSIGLEMVLSMDQLSSAFERISKISNEILIEQFIAGDELTVGILGDEALPVIRIKTDRSFYDFEAKYSPGHTQYEVPARLPKEIFQKVQEAALKAYRALGCRDLSRVDFMLDAQGRPWILEVNTIPGFTETSLLPKAAKAVGISFEDLCDRILKMVLRRMGSHGSTQAVRF